MTRSVINMDALAHLFCLLYTCIPQLTVDISTQDELELDSILPDFKDTMNKVIPACLLCSDTRYEIRYVC